MSAVWTISLAPGNAGMRATAATSAGPPPSRSARRYAAPAAEALRARRTARNLLVVPIFNDGQCLRQGGGKEGGRFVLAEIAEAAAVEERAQRRHEAAQLARHVAEEVPVGLLRRRIGPPRERP